jgi:hypothetical protein
MLSKEIVPGGLRKDYQREEANNNNDSLVCLQRGGLLDHSATVTRLDAVVM